MRLPRQTCIIEPLYRTDTACMNNSLLMIQRSIHLKPIIAGNKAGRPDNILNLKLRSILESHSGSAGINGSLFQHHFTALDRLFQFISKIGSPRRFSLRPTQEEPPADKMPSLSNHQNMPFPQWSWVNNAVAVRGPNTFPDHVTVRPQSVPRCSRRQRQERRPPEAGKVACNRMSAAGECPLETIRKRRNSRSPERPGSDDQRLCMIFSLMGVDYKTVFFLPDTLHIRLKLNGRPKPRAYDFR